MSPDYNYDLAVIGSGPAGYVGAIRAAQLGLKTVVIEKDKTGGVCLNIGCIPSKSLINQANIFKSTQNLEAMGLNIDYSGFYYSKVFKKSRKAPEILSRGVEYLLKKNNIELIKGNAVISGTNEITIDNERKISTKNILIATGSRSRQIPGFEVDEKMVLSSTGFLMLEKLPKKMLVMGSGAIGIEAAYIMNAFGVDVHVVEMLDRILPFEDDDVVNVISGSFKKTGIKTSASTKAVSLKKNSDNLEITLRKTDGEESIETVDLLLAAAGRVANIENIGLENAGVKTGNGFVQTGDYYKTSVPSIYAAGDIAGSPLLAHAASKEAEIAVEHMAGHGSAEKKLDPLLIPGAIYCEPQIARFGYTEREAKEKGISFNNIVFPYKGVGKAVAVEKSDGMIKLLFKPDTREIIGAHIVGADATELIHEILLARAAGIDPKDVGSITHAHPSLSEAVMEAMRSVDGLAIHV